MKLVGWSWTFTPPLPTIAKLQTVMTLSKNYHYIYMPSSQQPLIGLSFYPLISVQIPRCCCWGAAEDPSHLPWDDTVHRHIQWGFLGKHTWFILCRHLHISYLFLAENWLLLLSISAFTDSTQKDLLKLIGNLPVQYGGKSELWHQRLSKGT